MEDDPEVLPFHQRIDVQCDICGKVMTKGQFSTLVCFNCWGTHLGCPRIRLCLVNSVGSGLFTPDYDTCVCENLRKCGYEN
eukprot:g26834.t1